jgi:hypothetical protein
MEMPYLIYLFLWIKQVCMCDQWLVLDTWGQGAQPLVFYELFVE